MAKQVWVSRRVGKYRVGAWVPAKLIGLGYLLFFALGIYGLILVASKPQEDPSITEWRKKWRACVATQPPDPSQRARVCGPTPPIEK
ncbi:hypothetical protein ABIE88_003421 [Bradyrhizobium diazoefficiens]|uniref:hypothetical protein n=1 Tax=Bradyrhizobium diazoefficiens TaxID=1355477 RepID=UPI003517C4D5